MILVGSSVWIGACCIANRIDLLHYDRDFDPLLKYLGLRVV